VPVGYGDNPPVEPGPARPKGSAGTQASDTALSGKPGDGLPPAGPHDDPALTNPDSTPGTGALPPPGAHDDVDSTSS
jgi:hypothetical protein